MYEVELRTILFIVGTGMVALIVGIVIGYIGKCL